MEAGVVGGTAASTVLQQGAGTAAAGWAKRPCRGPRDTIFIMPTDELASVTQEGFVGWQND